MTATHDPRSLSGEQRLKSRRFAFFRFCGIAAIVAAIVGFASGTTGRLVVEGTFPAWAFVALWALALAGSAWFTIAYFRRIDELDVLDNLWSSTLGLYAYLLLFVSWHLFADIGLTEGPDQSAIAFATIAVTFAAYVLRKLGWR